MRLKPLIIAVAGLGLAAYLWPTYELRASLGPFPAKPQWFIFQSDCLAAKSEIKTAHVWGCE